MFGNAQNIIRYSVPQRGKRLHIFQAISRRRRKRTFATGRISQTTHQFLIRLHMAYHYISILTLVRRLLLDLSSYASSPRASKGKPDFEIAPLKSYVESSQVPVHVIRSDNWKRERRYGFMLECESLKWYFKASTTSVIEIRVYLITRNG